MSLIAQVTSAKRVRHRRTVIYGGHGWGKSTWCSGWKDPVFILTEDGVSHLDVPAFPPCESFLDVTSVVQELLSADKIPWKTLVIDSADWCEQLIWREVEQTNHVETIAEIDFGRGYVQARKKWRSLLRDLDLLRDRGMHIVFTAHQHVVRVKRTDGGEYDQCQPKLHKAVCEDVMEWCDELLHADWRITTRKTNPKGPPAKQSSVGVAHGRTLYTRESPQRLAKSRLLISGSPLPEEVEVPDEPTESFSTYRELLMAGYKS